MLDIECYRLPDGLAPVEEFVYSLGSKMRVHAISSFALLEEYGYLLREPHSEHSKMGCLNCESICL